MPGGDFIYRVFFPKEFIEPIPKVYSPIHLWSVKILEFARKYSFVMEA